MLPGCNCDNCRRWVREREEWETSMTLDEARTLASGYVEHRRQYRVEHPLKARDNG